MLALLDVLPLAPEGVELPIDVSLIPCRRAASALVDSPDRTDSTIFSFVSTECIGGRGTEVSSRWGSRRGVARWCSRSRLGSPYGLPFAVYVNTTAGPSEGQLTSVRRSLTRDNPERRIASNARCACHAVGYRTLPQSAIAELLTQEHPRD